MNMSSFSQKFHRGFTLIEVLVSLFVFLIIMTAVTNTFTSGFFSYKNTKIAQKNVENAQFALNLMAKELRTSTIVSSSVTMVRFYDYSQNMCLEYQIVGGELKVTKREPDNTSPTPVNPDNDCGNNAGYSSLASVVKTEMNGGEVTGSLRVIPSDPTSSPKKVGKVTISLQIQESANQIARIQTTVSLRDYGFSGIQ